MSCKHHRCQCPARKSKNSMRQNRRISELEAAIKELGELSGVRDSYNQAQKVVKKALAARMEME